MCKTLLALTLTTIAITALAIYLHSPWVTQLTYKNSHIQINRDKHGIPTVTAESLEQAMYGWGYAVAEDRLFQISFRRQVGQGRLSELFGEQMLFTDQMMREIDFYGKSVQTARNV